MKFDKKRLWIRIKKQLLSWKEYIIDWRFALCFLIGWMITNGWCYIGLWVGAAFKIGWLAAVSGAWAAILWLPFTPEKIVTVGIALGIMKIIFPNHKRIKPSTTDNNTDEKDSDKPEDK